MTTHPSLSMIKGGKFIDQRLHIIFGKETNVWLIVCDCEITAGQFTSPACMHLVVPSLVTCVLAWTSSTEHCVLVEQPGVVGGLRADHHSSGSVSHFTAPCSCCFTSSHIAVYISVSHLVTFPSKAQVTLLTVGLPAWVGVVIFCHCYRFLLAKVVCCLPPLSRIYWFSASSIDLRSVNRAIFSEVLLVDENCRASQEGLLWQVMVGHLWLMSKSLLTSLPLSLCGSVIRHYMYTQTHLSLSLECPWPR